jgi:hypothetical protein
MLLSRRGQLIEIIAQGLVERIVRHARGFPKRRTNTVVGGIHLPGWVGRAACPVFRPLPGMRKNPEARRRACTRSRKETIGLGRKASEGQAVPSGFPSVSDLAVPAWHASSLTLILALSARCRSTPDDPCPAAPGPPPSKFGWHLAKI